MDVLRLSFYIYDCIVPEVEEDAKKLSNAGHDEQRSTALIDRIFQHKAVNELELFQSRNGFF